MDHLPRQEAPRRRRWSNRQSVGAVSFKALCRFGGAQAVAYARRSGMGGHITGIHGEPPGSKGFSSFAPLR